MILLSCDGSAFFIDSERLSPNSGWQRTTLFKTTKRRVAELKEAPEGQKEEERSENRRSLFLATRSRWSWRMPVVRWTGLHMASAAQVVVLGCIVCHAHRTTEDQGQPLGSFGSPLAKWCAGVSRVVLVLCWQGLSCLLLPMIVSQPRC